MTKHDFLNALRKKLSYLPKEEIRERLNFYSEMIDDRMEEGLSEEAAVSGIGSVDEIAAQILSDAGNSKSVQKKRNHAWRILLIVLGSPVWLSLLLSAVAIGISLFVSLWTCITSLWGTFIALVLCGFGCLLAAAGFALFGYGTSGLFLVAVGLICAGAAMFFLLGVKYLTEAVVWLTKRIFRKVGSCLGKRRCAHG